MAVFRALLSVLALLLPSLAVSAAGQVPGNAPRALAAGATEVVPVTWLEPADMKSSAEGRGRLQTFRLIPASDPRVRDAERLIDNEPARFTRRLIAWAWQTFGGPADWPDRRLPIVLQPGGNYARTGFRLQTGGKLEEHPDVPYIILELDAGSLSDTLLHEGAHVLHTIAAHGHRPTTDWSAIDHTTFAVTDPLTALAEGYAIHFETLLGHYGRDPKTREYYHRLAPSFDLKASRRAEFYAPIADLMTFSQSWARYQAVRDTWPAFAGHVYPGDYIRSQFDPARDRSLLKPASAMLASEGVVASVLFWTSAGLADAGGAAFGGGLEQPAIADAEQVLLRAIATLPARHDYRPDLVDLVAAIGEPGSRSRALATSRFVTVTRGVTARPEVRAKWTALYEDAIGLDIDATKPIFAELDALRDTLIAEALANPAVLRRGVGVVLPVSAAKVLLQLKAFGKPFPLEFDLNAATAAELVAVGADAATCDRVLAERDKTPFVSLVDFEKRTGLTLSALGLQPIDGRQPPL